MRAAWPRAARPRLDGHAALHHPPTIPIVRRATSAPTRQGWTFSDAFTLLLAPVLATALIADVSWKDKRRKEWHQQIAEVEAQVECLRASERQAWQNLQMRSIQSGLAFQRRSYSSSAAPARASEGDEEEDLQLPAWEGADVTGHETTDLGGVTDDTVAGSEAEAALKRLERLVAVKLAITMILHVHIGIGTRVRPGELSELENMPQNIGLLVQKLKQSRISIQTVKKNIGSQRLRSSRADPAQEELDNYVYEITKGLTARTISPTLLVEQFGQRLLRSSAAPSSAAYVALFRTLSCFDHSTLALQVISAMQESRAPLDRHAVYHVLLEYGRRRELYLLDNFLRNLTKSEKKLNTAEEWRWEIVNGVQVPVPESQDPRLLQILIYAALKCHQLHRAEAWAAILRRQAGCEVNMSYVLTNFLQYHAAQQDWRNGQKWLILARDWATTLASIAMSDLQRVIFRMLYLCKQCQKERHYQEILKASVSARIGSFQMRADISWRIWPQFKSIALDWQSRVETAVPSGIESMQPKEKAHIFRTHLLRLFELIPIDEKEYTYPEGASVIGLPSGTADVSSRDARQSSSELTAHNQHQAKLADLEQQLTSSRVLLNMSRFNEQMRKNEQEALAKEVGRIQHELDHYRGLAQHRGQQQQFLEQVRKDQVAKFEAEAQALRDEVARYKELAQHEETRRKEAEQKASRISAVSPTAFPAQPSPSPSLPFQHHSIQPAAINTTVVSRSPNPATPEEEDEQETTNPLSVPLRSSSPTKDVHIATNHRSGSKVLNSGPTISNTCRDVSSSTPQESSMLSVPVPLSIRFAPVDVNVATYRRSGVKVLKLGGV